MHVGSIAVIFSQVAGNQSLSCVGVDVDEVRGREIREKDDQSHDDCACVVCSGLEDGVAEEDCECDHEKLRSDAIESDTGVIAREEMGSLTNGLTLSCCVAVRNSAEMDVSVGIGSDHLEDAIAATATILEAF